MSGEPADRNDDELLSQIDELKARMDRLMRGGTSTSNSALLTDSAKAKDAEPASAAKAEQASPPARTRVRDLIETEDTEIVEVYPGPKAVVPFPADMNPVPPQPRQSAPPAPKPEKKPPVRPKNAAVGGSLISVDGSVQEPRPHASTFDEMGNAMQKELAKDSSVPPGAKKGPDLASRFGSADDSSEVEKPERKTVEPLVADESDQDEEVEEYDDHEDADVDAAPDPVVARHSPSGLVAAIWVFTALVSGAIATLHFTGAI